jgi:hypothetical protein
MTFKEYLISKGLTEEQATTIVEGMPESKFYLSRADSKAKIAEQEKDFSIKLALKEAHALDEDIVLGQLDKDTIKIVDGKLQGFDEQLKGLQENKSFLFQQATEGTGTSPTITVGGNAKGGQNSAVGPQPEKLNEFRITR